MLGFLYLKELLSKNLYFKQELRIKVSAIWLCSKNNGGVALAQLTVSYFVGALSCRGQNARSQDAFQVLHGCDEGAASV